MPEYIYLCVYHGDGYTYNQNGHSSYGHGANCSVTINTVTVMGATHQFKQRQCVVTTTSNGTDEGLPVKPNEPTEPMAQWTKGTNTGPTGKWENGTTVETVNGATAWNGDNGVHGKIGQR